MADKKQNAEQEQVRQRLEQAKLEYVKKADAAVKQMSDFTSPEVLYNELITGVKKISSFYGYFHDTESI